VGGGGCHALHSVLCNLLIRLYIRAWARLLRVELLHGGCSHPFSSEFNHGDHDIGINGVDVRIVVD